MATLGATPSTTEWPLTSVEGIAYRGIAAREQTMQQQLRAELAELTREVEARLGLPPGAFGTTHVLDAERMVIVEVPQAETSPVPPIEGEEG